MIVGNGDLASVLPDRKDLLFFASGVSNSQETRSSEYQREKDLLLEQDKNRHIVYFGSLSIFYSDSLYARHKKRMERLVKENFDRYTIMRLGNISWGTNPHTIINYFREQVRLGKPLDIQDVYRYIIDKEEFLYWVGMIPDWSCEMNCPGRRLKIKDIVNEFVYTGLRPPKVQS